MQNIYAYFYRRKVSDFRLKCLCTPWKCLFVGGFEQKQEGKMFINDTFAKDEFFCKNHLTF